MSKLTGTPDATLVASVRIAHADHCDGTLTCRCPPCSTERGARVKRGCGPEPDDRDNPSIAHMMRANRGPA
jgi:hypothetical protein